jgi:glycosyltransferase involved in cell wall biosynthesis
LDQEPQNRPAILYFGNDWFAENRTSSHQIARWLAKRFRVYYIECPGLRAPKGSGRDLKKIWTKLAKFLRGSRTVPEGLKVRTLLQIPLHRFALVRRLNQALIIATLRWLKWREGIHLPITWFLVPHLAGVVGKLDEQLSVYYCIDDYAALPDVNPEAVRAMDDELTRKADLVFVASDTLLEGKRRLNPHSFVSPHGVDIEHFGKAQDQQLPAPADVADLPRPIIGFFGLIERWIELDLIDYLAQQRPHWSIVMIGRIAVPEESVPRRPNIHYLGKRSYDDLPAYGKQFDVAIIPYHLTQQVLHSNPIKLREYLAMGKPIVSVSAPEIDKYADVVAIARSHEEYLAQIDAALKESDPVAASRRRRARVMPESWNARLETVLETVMGSLKTGEPPRAAMVSAGREAG